MSLALCLPPSPSVPISKPVEWSCEVLMSSTCDSTRGVFHLTSEGPTKSKAVQVCQDSLWHAAKPAHPSVPHPGHRYTSMLGVAKSWRGRRLCEWTHLWKWH
eukprot:1767907-Alexandrium_andersonii.AAC.1